MHDAAHDDDKQAEAHDTALRALREEVAKLRRDIATLVTSSEGGGTSKPRD
jgi:hypothetical protein